MTIAAPADWRIERQLPRQDENTFVARDYDHLIDSPTIAAPPFTRQSFSESGATIHLVYLGADRIDTDQFVDPIRAAVRTQAAMFGGLPVREYRFLIHIGDKWHGVEHEASCSIVAKRSDLRGARTGELQNDMHDRANALISFYNKSEVVAALLDLLILRESKGAKSLDDVMRLLWSEQKPLQEDDFERAVIDGARTTSELEAKSVLHSLDEGTAVEMIVSRAGVVRVMSLTAATEPRVKITLRATDWSVLRDRWLQDSYRG